MPSVYLSSRFNSTMFTTCCSVAICDDQEACPQCKQIIEPQGHRARWERAYGPQRRELAEKLRRTGGSHG
jgi:hypothetical protein